MQIGLMREIGGKLYPFAAINVAGNRGSSLMIPAIVDTGFDGWLALPATVVLELELQRDTDSDLEFADSRRETVRTFRANVMWAERRFNVVVHETGNQATIGTALLRDYNLSMDACNLGHITLQPI